MLRMNLLNDIRSLLFAFLVLPLAAQELGLRPPKPRVIAISLSDARAEIAQLLRLNDSAFVVVCPVASSATFSGCSRRIELPRNSDRAAAVLALTKDYLFVGLRNSAAGNGEVPSLDITARGNAPWAQSAAVAAAGNVAIWRRGTDGWNAAGFLPSTAPRSNDFCGTSLAVDSGWLAIGCPGEASGGSVHMYRVSGERVTFSQNISGKAGDAFGSRLAQSDGWLAVVAPTRQSGRGTVSMYTLVEQKWSARQEIMPPEKEIGRFAWRLALKGKILAITSSVPAGPGSDTGAQPGSVDLYLEESGSWHNQGQLYSSREEVIKYNRLITTDGLGNRSF